MQNAEQLSRIPDDIMPNDSGFFSIATPAVTTILPMTENINDSSFLLPSNSYQHDGTEKSSITEPEQANSANTSSSLKCQSTHSGTRKQEVTQTSNKLDQDGPIANEDTVDDNSTALHEDESKSSKKRSKASKKSTKLDAKSKLEKSRQSARECRARKKLRYQYLEDLVCNREKAVVKLREELSTFCELAKKVDVGNVNESDRRLLKDQSKENAQNDSTSLL